MFTKRSISTILFLFLFIATTNGTALTHSPNSTRPFLNSHNFTTNTDATDICASATEIPQSECEALEALYKSTNGRGWIENTDWLETDTPCSWYGVYCTDGQIFSLYLGANELKGSIPSQLGDLTKLQELHLGYNKLSGSIPPQLGNLTQLTELFLWHNQLSGSIPSQLGNLTQLTELVLWHNQLSGSIPYQLGNLTQLQWLFLGDNKLSGSIPYQLGNLTQLRSLDFDSNSLSGSLPVSLEKLTQLKEFYFNGTHLCEPSEAAFQNWLKSISYLKSTNICPVTISGNAGDTDVVLRFSINGIPKTVTSANNGRYTITVPSGWSGKITPSKSGTSFTPACRTFTNLATNQINQNYADIVSFVSTAAYDGWILESAKGTGKGGTMNSQNTTFQLGDDNLNRQYRAVLSFNTAALPDTAVVQSALLKIKPSGSPIGTNPFTVLGTLYTDIRKGYFSTSPALELADFNNAATASKIASFGKTPLSGWYSATLTATGKDDINKTSLTQLRLYFATPTNNNNSSNDMLFFSGNAAVGNQPLLVITYSLP